MTAQAGAASPGAESLPVTDGSVVQRRARSYEPASPLLVSGSRKDGRAGSRTPGPVHMACLPERMTPLSPGRAPRRR
jgi:hypothetical protein